MDMEENEVKFSISGEFDIAMDFGDDQAEEECLKYLAQFEDHILAPLRSAKSISCVSVAKSIGWALTINQILCDLDLDEESKGDQLWKVYAALLDNPRLSKSDVQQFSYLFENTSMDLEQMKYCLEGREELKAMLFDLNVVTTNRSVKELLRSNRGDFQSCKSKLDVLLEMTKDMLESKTFMDDTKKTKVITSLMEMKEFRKKSAQERLLKVVEKYNASLLEKIYESYI